MNRMTMHKPMRRSSLIGPWGVGAIVPFPNDESLMIAGLDMWRYNNTEKFVIRDERLEKRLGIKELRYPPEYMERNADPGSEVSKMVLLSILRDDEKNDLL